MARSDYKRPSFQVECISLLLPEANMKSYQAVACAFLVCLAIGGARGFDDDYGIIKKVIVYGKDKVVLPTMKNMLIVFDELLSKSLKYAPKAVKSELEDLLYKLRSFSVSNKKIISQAEYILNIIEKGYISDCDFAKQLEESMYTLITMLKYCTDDYTYNYHV